MRLFRFLSSPSSSKKSGSPSFPSLSSSSFSWSLSKKRSISQKPPLRFERSKELEETFMLLDANGDGLISIAELKASMRSLFAILQKQKVPSDEELALMMAEVDKDGDGLVSFEDFREFLFSSSNYSSSSSSSLSSCKLGGREEAVWFHAMDLNNDGMISCKELHEVMMRLGIKSCTLKECCLIIHAHDSDGDGLLNTQEFRKLFLG